MTDRELTRRQLLGGSVVGIGALTVTGSSLAVGRKKDRYNVGIDTPSAAAAVDRAAEAVDRVMALEGERKVITGRFSEQAVAALRRRPGVRYVERDGQVQAIAAAPHRGQSVPWGVDRVDADVAHANGETGAGDVAIVDTGIDSDHPDLVDNLGTGTALAEAGSGYAEPWDDDHGHGTHVAGIAGAVDDDGGVVGVSPDATLHAVKVLNEFGAGSFSDVAAGITWVADQGYDVANMSLGGGKSYAVEDAVEYAYGAGVLLIAAAGNIGPCEGCVHYPAREPEVVAVSATDRDDSLAVFSSTGPQVDVAAPGVAIPSTFPDGEYGALSGTSMAAPHVAGAGAHLMATGRTNTAARDALERSAEDVGLGDDEQGYGLLDVAAGLDLDSGDDEAELGDTVEPAIEGFEVSTAPGPGGRREVTVDWAVTDGDGDLASVDLSLAELGPTGLRNEIEDAATVGVDGDAAAATTTLVADGDGGEGYRVRLVVVDAADNTTVAATDL